MQDSVRNLFSINGAVSVITGGGGVIGAKMAEALSDAGSKVVLIDRNGESSERIVSELRKKKREAIALRADVLSKESLEKAHEETIRAFGTVSILINGAGGNMPKATTSKELSFFDIKAEDLQAAINLNLTGSVLSSQVFGKTMADAKKGVIINISSMNSFRPLTRIVGYSAAKAAVNNFTQWLSTHMAMEYSPRIRVNAIAPGFFETKQNEYLLRDAQTGKLTVRGEEIIKHTPGGRFGTPEDLIGTLLWLVSPASEFVTGVVVPVDGGFSAYSGV